MKIKIVGEFRIDDEDVIELIDQGKYRNSEAMIDDLCGAEFPIQIGDAKYMATIDDAEKD